jgi:hypothetical protein
MIFQFLSPFRARFSALPIRPGYPGSCFSFPLVRSEPGLSTGIVFTRLSFPPLDRPYGASASGYGHWFSLQKAPGSRGPVGLSRINPLLRVSQIASYPDNDSSCHGTSRFQRVCQLRGPFFVL